MPRMLKGGASWMLTTGVLLVILGAGARLIYLSAQHHEALAREQAATLAGSFVSKIEPQVRALAALAARQGKSADRTLIPGAF